MSKKLTEFEKKVYDFIKEHDEMIVSRSPAFLRLGIAPLMFFGTLETIILSKNMMK